MTRMLVRLKRPDEAALAAAADIDVVEIVIAPDIAVLVRAVRAAFPRTLRVRIDDPTRQPGVIEAAVSLGADEIALPHHAVTDAAALLKTLAPLVRPVGLVAVLAAGEAGSDVTAAPAACAIALDAPPGRRLLDVAAIDRLDAFARACRAASLPFGLAGGLEAPDVARLLLLGPDLLGFDLALRHAHEPEGDLDHDAVATLRALIPRHAAPRASRSEATGTDCIFVHDFVTPVSIGAYHAERGGRQRVRFHVDAMVRRPAKAPTDMGGVFSYDIIIETIRVLAARPHVLFVETLAEDLASALLAHAPVEAVAIKVEKLDVIDAAVGVSIHRTRPASAS